MRLFSARRTIEPTALFDIKTSVELAIFGTRGRLIFAGIYALAAFLIQAWWISVVWIVLIVTWELLARPALDRLVLTLPSDSAMAAYACVNCVGSVLFACMPLMGLRNGSPIGVALAATWLSGSFIGIFIYFSADRRLLWACLTPPLLVALVGPVLAHGAFWQSAPIGLLILASMASTRGYAVDHQALIKSLADRQMAFSDIERKLAVAIEASGDGLFDLNLERGEAMLSPTWMSMLGYAAGDVPQPELNWRRHVHPEDLPLLEDAYAAHFRGETPHTVVEHRMLCRDGSTKWVLSRARLVERTADGRPLHIVGTTMDLTLRKALEQQLEAARDAAEVANQAKGAFLANMSHEIRTPLNGVIGTAGALARRALPAEERGMVALIQSSGKTLDRLLSDILDQAKMESGQFELLIAPFDLHVEIETAAELMRARADEKGVALSVNYGPSARGDFKGDAVRIRQIISNLASNAIKFTTEGEVRIDLKVLDPTGATGSSTLQIEVIDSGIGFETETAKRLFTRFTQADGSISRRFGGTGLGLAICKTLVELMRGKISVTSEPNVGTRFVVQIPIERTLSLADYDRQQAAGPSSDETGANSARRLDGLRVLLAEDHPINQRVAQLILEPSGVKLTVVENGKEAVELFRPGRFDLILMDMQMPVMDGLAAMREIRRQEHEHGISRIPIAMLTANAMREHALQAAGAGADHLIAKPITPESLLEGIDLTLAKAIRTTSGRENPTASC